MLLNFHKIVDFSNRFFTKFWNCSGAKGCKPCRSWKMQSNAYFLAKFRFDTAENEPARNLQKIVKQIQLFFKMRSLRIDAANWRQTIQLTSTLTRPELGSSPGRCSGPRPRPCTRSGRRPRPSPCWRRRSWRSCLPYPHLGKRRFHLSARDP